MGKPETILAANNYTSSSFSALVREHPPQTSEAYSRWGLIKDVYIVDSVLRFYLNLNFFIRFNFLFAVLIKLSI